MDDIIRIGKNFQDTTNLFQTFELIMKTYFFHIQAYPGPRNLQRRRSTVKQQYKARKIYKTFLETTSEWSGAFSYAGLSKQPQNLPEYLS